MPDISFIGKVKELVRMPNIASEMDEDDRKAIGLACLEEFKADKAGRADWEEAYAKAMKLALQVMEEKTFPWPNCSNVKFPLLTVAAINFHARAYPALISGDSVVTYRVIGDDPNGTKAILAKRIEKHQNFQLLEATDWEEQTDKALLVTPIMGCSFKKTFTDIEKGSVRSKLVLPQDLVVPYYTASLETCPRASEMFSLSKNSFVTRKRKGLFLDKDYDANYSCIPSTDALEDAKREAQHVNPTTTTDEWIPTELVEQHRSLDLDDDGYAEPYVVTFVRQTGEICRIVARYTSSDIEYNTKGQITYINPTHYYTKMPFIPSPDGGFYDLGFGMLLGPLNHAVDSLINQMLDAGTMEILGGGFLGRGVKIKRGENTFAPYEWKTVESPGVALKDNIVPLPTRSPSQVLFELLSYLVGYAERISSANEVQMGELPGSQQKTGAMDIANNNGLKIFAAIYKRWWRAQKEEFVKIYRATTLAPFTYTQGAFFDTKKWFSLTPDDYQLPPDGIWPSADPNIASKEMMVKQAAAILQLARESGGNIYKATLRLCRAMDVPAPEEIFPGPTPPPPDPKLIDAQSKAMLAQAKVNALQQSHVVATAELLIEASKIQAVIYELHAKATKEYAEAHGVETGHNIALIQSKIAAEEKHYTGIIKLIDVLQKGVKDAGTAEGEPSGAGVSGVEDAAAKPDVLSLSGGSASMA